MHSFTVNERMVNVFPAALPGAPAIYLNTFGDEGARVLSAAQAAGCPDFTLVSVSGLNWNRDMVPWDCPPAFKNTEPLVGNADGYLQILTEEIIPAAEQTAQLSPIWRGIAGYSLAGLFAVYSLYHTDLFSRAASMSGSLWFPGIKDYVFSHIPKRRPDCVYFSLGDKESKTRNAMLKEVQQNTSEIQQHFQHSGVRTIFTLNPGNHNSHTVERTAAGIRWLLEQ